MATYAFFGFNGERLTDKKRKLRKAIRLCRRAAMKGERESTNEGEPKKNEEVDINIQKKTNTIYEGALKDQEIVISTAEGVVDHNSLILNQILIAYAFIEILRRLKIQDYPQGIGGGSVHQPILYQDRPGESNCSF
ncbi:hypothetical protein ACFE04_027619 [Oxalis oulophora]